MESESGTPHETKLLTFITVFLKLLLRVTSRRPKEHPETTASMEIKY